VIRLLVWHPTDEGDRAIRAYLLAFAQRVILEDRKVRPRRRPELNHSRAQEAK
jgi:hypothetical protein